MEPITGKGYLGVILIRALDMPQPDVLEKLDYIRAYCIRHGYKIVVEKLEPQASSVDTAIPLMV